MIPLSCAGYVYPIDDRHVEAVNYTAVGIRTGPCVNDSHEPIDAIVKKAAQEFSTSIFIVAGWDWRNTAVPPHQEGHTFQRRDANLLEDPGKEHIANQCASILAVWKQSGREYRDCIIEIGNELDGSYWKDNLDEFFELAMHSYDRIRSITSETPIVTGSTMNFNKEPFWKKGGYEIFRELCALAWPKDTWQGLHPYRGDGGRTWPSWDSDQDALEEIARLLDGRDLAITEMGWASRTGHSDSKIAAMVAQEIQMWNDFGATCYAHYQIQDGPIPDNAGEGGFGAYTSLENGLKKKPVAEPLHGYVEMRAT